MRETRGCCINLALPFSSQASVETNRHKYSHSSGKHVGGRLRVQYAVQAETRREDQDGGYETDPLSASAENAALFRFPHHEE